MAMNEAKLQQWCKHISGWKSSGLTQRAYCEREGLSLTSLAYWSPRVRKSARGYAGAVESGVGVHLVPVRIQGPRQDGQLLLRSPGGWSVALPASAGAEWLGSVLKQLP